MSHKGGGHSAFRARRALAAALLVVWLYDFGLNLDDLAAALASDAAATPRAALCSSTPAAACLRSELLLAPRCHKRLADKLQPRLQVPGALFRIHRYHRAIICAAPAA